MFRPVATLLAAAALLALPTPAGAQIRIGVVISITGPAAALGVPQRNTVALLPKEAAGQSIEYIVMDDATDSARAVANSRKLADENRVDAIIGSTITPASLAMIAVAAEKQIPIISFASSSRVIAPMDDQRRWVFKSAHSDSLMMDAVAEHMYRAGVKTVGFIGFADAYGDGWHTQAIRALEQWGVKLVAAERYARPDTDVSAQAAKLLAAKPDAVLIGGSGTPAAVPEKALRALGYTGTFYATDGVASLDFVRAGGRDAEGTVLPTGPILVMSQLPDGDPVKAMAGEYAKRYDAAYGPGAASTLGAYLYDASTMLQQAIPIALLTAKPGTPAFRAALRDALEVSYGLVLVNGISEMSADDHNGFDKRARVMVTIQDGAWKLLR